MTNLDISTCDQEKIHLITQIQGHGAFLAGGLSDLRIYHVSENLSAFFGQSEPAKMFINDKLNSVLPHELFRQLQTTLRENRVYPLSLRWQGFDLYLFKIDENLVGIEFEKLPAEGRRVDSSEVIREFLEGMKDATDVAELGLSACRAVRTLTGMARVMLYRFFPPSMYGEVIAEDRVAGAHSFGGHRFPSTDIPKPARDLYLKNSVRLISDSHEPTVGIFPGLDKRGPLDMSDSRLRGVSLVHIEYLKNMGVRGSFSVAVKVDNKLWGLIACHSHEPTFITQSIRAHCETIANCLALSAPLLERTLEQTEEIGFNQLFNNFFVGLKDTQKPFDEIFKNGAELNKIFKTEGFAVVSGPRVTAFGLTPLASEVLKLTEWVNHYFETNRKSILVTDSLTGMEEEFLRLKDQASGLIAVKLSESDESLLILFRPEILQTIQWGGDPRKNFEQRNYQGIINPRVSFETWSEIIKNTSSKWLRHEIEGAKTFKNLIFDSLIKDNELIQELGSKLQKKL